MTPLEAAHTIIDAWLAVSSRRTVHAEGYSGGVLLYATSGDPTPSFQASGAGSAAAHIALARQIASEDETGVHRL